MLNSEEKNGFLFRHRFFFVFFFYLLVYHIVIVKHLSPWELSDFTYVQYCVDFSYGFGSKLLPGAIFNLLLGSHASRSTANIYTITVILLFFAGLALLLDRFMHRIAPSDRNTAVFVFLFFLSGAYTFSIFTKWIGILDTYWLIIGLLLFVFLEHRLLRFFIPLLFISALMIHFSALVFYLTVFSIIILYRISVTEKKHEKKALWTVFAVSMAVTAVSFLFLLFYEPATVCSLKEFHNKLSARGTDYYFYHDYAFFRIWDGESFIPEYVNSTKSYFLKFLYLFYYQVALNFDLVKGNVWHGIITTAGGVAILLPCLCFILPVHYRRMHEAKNKLSRFCSFLMLVQFPFVFMLGILFAIGIDMTRYLTHGFLGLCACMLSILYHEGKERTRFFEQIRSVTSSAPAKIYILAYMAITLNPI